MTEREKLQAEMERAKAKAHTNALREYDLKGTEREKLVEAMDAANAEGDRAAAACDRAAAVWDRAEAKWDRARGRCMRAVAALKMYDRKGDA